MTEKLIFSDIEAFEKSSLSQEEAHKFIDKLFSDSVEKSCRPPTINFEGYITHFFEESDNLYNERLKIEENEKRFKEIKRMLPKSEKKYGIEGYVLSHDMWIDYSYYKKYDEQFGRGSNGIGFSITIVNPITEEKTQVGNYEEFEDFRAALLDIINEKTKSITQAIELLNKMK